MVFDKFTPALSRLANAPIRVLIHVPGVISRLVPMIVRVHALQADFAKATRDNLVLVWRFPMRPTARSWKQLFYQQFDRHSIERIPISERYGVLLAGA